MLSFECSPDIHVKKKKIIISDYLVTVVILWMSVVAATALLDLSLWLNLSYY